MSVLVGPGWPSYGPFLNGSVPIRDGTRKVQRVKQDRSNGLPALSYVGREIKTEISEMSISVTTKKTQNALDLVI